MESTPNKKILVIEDDVFLGDILLQKLKTENYDAILSRDGKEGLEKIREIKPDLVLLDIILPSLNGYEILEQKKNDPTIADIPVVVISNSGQPVEIQRVLALGAKDYLIKAQFEAAEVVAKVKNFLDTNTTKVGEPSAGGDLQGKKVMWVEDDKFLSDLISRKLATQGCTLLHASDGLEAVGMAEKELPNIILLDILLPGMNGFDILQKIKMSPTTKNIPVLMLSNMGQRSDIEKSQKLGAAKFLVKATVTLDEIVREIKSSIA